MDLGLSDAEFWGLTLRTLYALLERWEAVQRRADLRIGLLASLLFNKDRKRGAKAMTAEDFFPG